MPLKKLKRLEGMNMKNNIMVIGNKKEKVEKVKDLVLKAAPDDASKSALDESQETFRVADRRQDRDAIREAVRGQDREAVREPVRDQDREPVYDIDWGNEQSVLNKLEGKFLADRRFYARALYMQKIECRKRFAGMVSEPSILTDPIEFMIIDLSMGGIGIICEYELIIGTNLLFNLSLDNIQYDIRCEVVYCFQNSDKYRAGLRIVGRDMKFIRHLKIFVARLSLQSKYGSRTLDTIHREHN